MGLKISLGIISLAFLILTVIHARNYRHLFPHPKPFHGIAKINGVSIGIVEFQQEVNSFVDALNRTHKSINLYAAVGYLLSFVATLISLIILCITE